MHIKVEMQFLEGGKNLTVYTGPKGGKFIIRKGKKVYVDQKSYNDDVPYRGKKSNKGKKA